MALYSCPGCKRDVSTDAKRCPSCGKDLRLVSVGPRWKALPKPGKIFLGVAVLVLAVGLWAAGGQPREGKPGAVAEPISHTAPSGVLLLAGKGEGEIADGLGQPVSRETTKYGPKLTYQLGSGARVEIVYIDGKADWITMTPPPGKAVPFAPAAIQGIGLAPAAPTFTAPDVIRWEHVQGLREVSVHVGAAGMVGYYYVKVRTE